MNAKSTIALMLVAGTAVAANDLTPTKVMPAKETRSLYISMSGERIQMNNATDVRGEEVRNVVWARNGVDPCGLSVDPDGLDDIPGTADDDNEFTIWLHAAVGFTIAGLPRETMVTANWGDVPADSLINAFATWTWYDLQDGVQDPENDFVQGFDLTIGFVDGFDGDVPPADAVAQVINYNIGEWEDAPSDLPPGYVVGTYFVLDLDGGATDASFELGDTDGMGPASGFFNANSFTDAAADAIDAPTGVGLHDFGYYRAYNIPQGGTVIGGVTAYSGSFSDVTYVESQGDFFSFVLGTENGVATGGEFNATSVHINGLDDTTGLPAGLEDDSADHLGYFVSQVGGPGVFTCGGKGSTVGDTPINDWMELFFDEGGGAPCVADFDGNGSVNILDVVAFIGAWNMGLDYNGDMAVNILDVVAFINDWNAAENCPTP